MELEEEISEVGGQFFVPLPPYLFARPSLDQGQIHFELTGKLKNGQLLPEESRGMAAWQFSCWMEEGCISFRVDTIPRMASVRQDLSKYWVEAL